MKNICLCYTDKCGKCNGKSGESDVYLFKILNAGGGGRCPYLNRKTLKKRNKRNIFYMKEKCGRISGYMFCFFIEAGWKIKEFDMKNGE